MRRSVTELLLVCGLCLSATLCLALPVPEPSVRPTAPAHLQTDREIEENVIKGLIANPYVFAARIRVKVVRGVVTLHGTVHNRAARTMAEKVTRAVRGVREVRNELHIRPAKR